MSITLHPARRGLVAAGIAVLVCLSASIASQWEIGVLAGWDAGVLAALILALTALSQTRSKRVAAGEAAPTGPCTLAAVAVAAVCGFIAALLLMGQLAGSGPLWHAVSIALALAAIVESWLLVWAECQLYFARLHEERRQAALFRHGRPAATLGQPMTVWEFIYYAFPIAAQQRPSDPHPITARMCQVAIVQSAATYAFVAIVISLVIRMSGPALTFANNILRPVLAIARVIPGG